MTMPENRQPAPAPLDEEAKVDTGTQIGDRCLLSPAARSLARAKGASRPRLIGAATALYCRF